LRVCDRRDHGDQAERAQHETIIAYDGDRVLTILLLSSIAGVTAFIAIRRPRARPGLPPPGPPPEDRGEAVRRVLKHLQRKTIAEIKEGDAAVIIGTVHALPGVATLVAPISAASCLGYHLDIRSAVFDQYMRLRQLHDDARCTLIEVRDETGSVLVDPQGLELAITDQPALMWHPPFPPHVLQRIPRGTYHLPVTVEEGLLQPGAKILVCGVAARELAATDYRDGEQRLVLRASATFPLVASTDRDLFEPGDRLIAPEELRRR
jgi:hypothetical protein